MKIQNVLLDDIVWNPWRDMKLYPLDDDHVADLMKSINDHGFFGGCKARRRNGKIELGCGHHRIAAARKAKLGSVSIQIDDIDDDTMLRLMTDENAIQSGSNPAAILNEVAAITRRLVEIILPTEDFAGISAKYLFEGAQGFAQARGRLLARLDDLEKDGGIGWKLMLRYLGKGREDKSPRKKQVIIDAISALKQSGRYDEIVDEALRKHPRPDADKSHAKGTAVVKGKPSDPKRRLLDERCANLFPNDHQFRAFREAVTTAGAQKAIPVDQQYALAKDIMSAKHSEFSKKQMGAPLIKKMVQARVQDYMQAQREIDKEERERYLAEQRESRVDNEIKSANSNLRGLLSAIAKLIDLAEQFPGHPKLGGFSARLDRLTDAIQQFSKKLK